MSDREERVDETVDFAGLLLARSRAELADGDVSGALEDLSLGNKIAAQLLQIPSSYAAAAAESIATREFAALQRALSAAPPQFGLLLDGIHDLAKTWPKARSADYYAASGFVFALGSVSHIGEPGYPLEKSLGVTRPLVPGNVAPELVREGYSARMIDFERQVMRILRSPSASYAKAVQRLLDVERADASKDQTRAANRALHGFEALSAIGPTLQTQSELLLLGVEIVRWRRMNSIHELPSITKYPDPFNTSEPLRVRAAPGGFMLYSVGPNGQDDRARQGSDDISFQCG